MRVATKRYQFPPVLILLIIAFPSVVFAHRLDEYLQATLVVIEPNRIRLQVNLTPGVAVADQVLSQIDIDHDGTISTNEAAAYCERLKRDLIVRIDQHRLEIKASVSYFPGLDELRSGWGFIQIEFAATTPPLSPGAHKLTVENRHQPNLTVYLLNATKPAANSIQIAAQVRNQNQSVGEIQFTIQTQAGSSKAARFLAMFFVVLVTSSLVATRRSTSIHQPAT